tara:strand:+ start:1342 stop:2652 length:1311 start_codon:yes stop_codon:yes gene_type:complete
MSKARNIADIGSDDVISTSSTGVDVTGTITSDGLTVDGDVVLNDQSVVIGSTANSYNEIRFFDSVNTSGATRIRSDASDLGLYTANAERMRIDSGGNVGIGGTPSAWSGTARVLEFDGQATDYIGFNSATSGYIYQNAYYDGTNNVYKNTGLATAYGQAAGVHSWFGAASGTAGATATLAERMRIDASGNVLVGTTAVDPIDVAAAGMTFWDTGSTLRLFSPGASLALGKNSAGDAAQFYYHNGTSAAKVGSISVTGSATAYNTSSDYRLKENITPIQGASDIVKQMRPSTYTFKSDGSWHDGFLAHELQELHPRAVLGSKDGMMDEEYEVTPAVYEDIIIPAVEAVAEVPAVYDAEGVLVSEMVPAVEAEAERTEQQLVSEAVMGTRSVPDYQGVDYSKLTPILTAALQEALTKIDTLEAQNATFEARLAALEAV